MLERCFERFIKSFLSPYVDGISHDNLRFGILRQEFIWEDVKVKEDALQLLTGRSDVHVRLGRIGSVQLKVPFKDIFSGKLEVHIKEISFEVDHRADYHAASSDTSASDEDQIAEYRTNRNKAIEARTKQLQLLLEEEERGAKHEPENEGLLRRLLRKILSNIEVKLEGVSLRLCSQHYGIAAGLQFDGLTCTSLPRSLASPEDQLASVMHLGKLVRLEGISVLMSKPHKSTLEGAERIITRTNAELGVDWADTKLRLSFKVEASHLAGLLIKRSHLKHLRKIMTLAGRDKRRLMAKIITPEDEKSIYENASSAKQEYKALYRRHLLNAWGLTDVGFTDEDDSPLSIKDEKRKQVLEDALAIVTIAKVRYLVQQNMKTLQEAASSCKELRKTTDSSLGSVEFHSISMYNLITRGLTRKQIADGLRDSDIGPESHLTAAERQQLMNGLDEEKLEKVNPPSTYEISFQVSRYAVDLVDDRWSNEVQRNLLSVAIKEVSCKVRVSLDTDYNGMDSVNWSAEFQLMTFNLLHGGEVIASFFQDSEDNWQRAMQEPQVDWAADEQEALLCRIEQASTRNEVDNDEDGANAGSVLRLDFQFAPVIIKWSYGLLDQLTEFMHAPEVPKDDDADGSDGSGYAKGLKWVEYHYDALQERCQEIARLYADNADKLNKAVEKVYEAPPTKLDINFVFSSPIVQVPVQDLGMSVFTFGKLEIKTPKPCPYTDLDLKVVLSKAQLRAEALKGECLIRPVEVRIGITYQNKEDGHYLKLTIEWDQMSTALSPRALQVLISTPMGMLAVMWEKYKELKAKASDVDNEDSDDELGDSESAPEQPSLVRHLTRSITAGLDMMSVSESPDVENNAFATASPLVMQNESISPSDTHRPRRRFSFHETSEDVKEAAVKLARDMMGLHATEKVQEVVEGVHKKVEAEKKKPFNMFLELVFAETELTLLDHAEPAMRFHGELPRCGEHPGFYMHFCNQPKEMAIDIKNGVLEWDCLNSRSGAWEPLGERFHLDMNIVWKKASEFSQTLNVTVKGQQQLLLNLTPNALQQAGHLLPQFGKALMFYPLESSPTNFVALNLTGRAVELIFYPSMNDRDDAPCSSTIIDPTAPEWKGLVSIDKFVHPHFAKSVKIGFPGERPEHSRLLYLDCTGGAVGIANRNIVLELRTPRPGHRLLLIATTLRVHNKTDLPMLIQFDKRGSFPKGGKDLDLTLAEQSTTCHASYLGGDVHEKLCLSREGFLVGGSGHLVDVPLEGAFLLKPNQICSVPASCIECRQDDLRRPRVKLKTKPMLPNVEFSKEFEVGDYNAKSGVIASQDGMAAQTVQCAGKQRQHIYFICEGRSEVQFLPSATAIATISLRPTLAIINAMPFGSLIVSYASTSGAQADRVPASGYSEAKVPFLCCFNLYNVPSVLQQGICLKTRLVLRGSAPEDAPWSKNVKFGSDAHVEHRREVIPIRHHNNGAEAGLVVEASAPFEFRFSSSSWFVDRSGLGEEVQVQYKQRDLPSEDGITLLPAENYNSEWREVNCELVLPRKAGASRSSCSQALRFPPDYCILPWHTPLGPCVFCVQCDEVDPGDVLGAQCSLITLRPRLILTNSSDTDLELRFPGQLAELPKGKSLPLHHPAGSGGAITLEFRPALSGYQWSGTVICDDEHVGSVPFLFPRPIDVWTVEVSPARGALAVSFRHGSEFVVMNTTNKKLTLFLPGPKQEVQIKVPPAGVEVPFGWYQPHKDSSRSVSFSRLGRGSGNVVVVPDVRNTSTSLHRGSYRIDRVSGTKHVLSLYAPKTTDASALKDFTVELKLNRLGISIIGQQPKPQELFFVRADLLRFLWHRKTNKEEDIQTFGLVISEAQVDCQLPGRVDSSKSDELKNERPIVVFANCAKGNRAFLELRVKKQYTGARELMFPLLDLAVDAVDITIDDDWIRPSVDFMKQSGLMSKSGKSGINLAYIRRMAGKSILDDYSPPALPHNFNLDLFRISELKATVWCAWKLQNLRFVKSSYVRDAISVLSFSNELKLDGAYLKLDAKQTRSHRGSLDDFGRFLKSEYTHGILSGAAVALGKSSLLKLPRLPIALGSSAISYFTTGIGLVAGETASLLDRLALDDEYVSHQRMIRENKDISSVSDGLAEAAKSLTDGARGLTDICKKPVVGAQEEGVGGFCSGLGRGALSGLVKPVSGLGQAISDIGTGISAQLSPNSGAMKRIRGRQRNRTPRLLFTELGALRPYSGTHASLLLEWGSDKMHGIQEVLLIEENRQSQIMLLLFPRKFVCVNLRKKLHDSSEAVRNETSQGGILEAAGESAEKLFGHIALPMTTMYQGILDIAGQNENVDENVDEKVDEKEMYFDQFETIDSSDYTDKKGTEKFVRLQDKKRQNHKFPLYAKYYHDVDKVADALVLGFRSALGSGGGFASWTLLQETMCLERRKKRDKELDHDLRSHRAGVGQRIVEVFEVERRTFTGEWATTGSPLDRELSYRWVNAQGSRHPNLKKDRTRKEIARATNPKDVIELETGDSMFQPVAGSEWECEAWKYGLAWNSSTWDPAESLFTGLRRRRWVRTYE